MACDRRDRAASRGTSPTPDRYRHRPLALTTIYKSVASTHFCIGAALARAEIELSLAALLARFSRIEPLVDDLEWHQIPVFRGFSRLLPLELGA